MYCLFLSENFEFQVSSKVLISCHRMADPSTCQDSYFRPARNYFNYGNIKISHGARYREYGS